MKKTKFVPGSGKYDTYAYDEKRIKPPRIGVNLKDPKFTIIDAQIWKSKNAPGYYPSIDLDKIKRKTYVCKLRPESEIEKSLEKLRHKKNDSPSPVTYNTEKAIEKTT